MLENLLVIFRALTGTIEETAEMVAAYDRLALHSGTSFGNALALARVAYVDVLKAEKEHDLEGLLAALRYYALTVQTVSRVGAGVIETKAHAAGVVAGSNSAACEAAYSEGVQDGMDTFRHNAEQARLALELKCRCLDPGMPVPDCPAHN